MSAREADTHPVRRRRASTTPARSVLLLPRWTVVVAIAVVLVLHPLLTAIDAPLVVVGVLDWAAHLATAILVLVNLPFTLPARMLVAALLASVVIDLDHVPHYLGEQFLTAGAPRPYTHSLASIVAALAVATFLRRDAHRAIAVGVALGLVAHLARDVATGPGIALLWPLTSAGVRIPFWLEAAGLAALATRGWLLADRLPLIGGSSDASSQRRGTRPLRRARRADSDRHVP